MTLYQTTYVHCGIAGDQNYTFCNPSTYLVAILTRKITFTELHGFSDASELAYAAVVYLRMTDSTGNVQVMLVTSKTKFVPIKRLTIPCLELCGTNILAQLLHHVRVVLEVPLSNTYAWIDSTIVLHWFDGNPRRFKAYN